jgi:hypothetical protein
MNPTTPNPHVPQVVPQAPIRPYGSRQINYNEFGNTRRSLSSAFNTVGDIHPEDEHVGNGVEDIQYHFHNMNFLGHQ